MLKAKSLLVIVALLIAFIGTSMAKEFPGDKAGKKADYLYKKLSLTNDQYTRVYQILFDYESKMYEKCHIKGHKCDEKCKTECKTAQGNVLNDIDKVLNKDQVVKFAPMKEKFFKMSMKKKVKKIKKEEGTEEVKKDTKKDEKKDVKKDVKKEEKKDVKKEEKKDDKKK
jgi:hypothetical protein